MGTQTERRQMHRLATPALSGGRESASQRLIRSTLRAAFAAAGMLVASLSPSFANVTGTWTTTASGGSATANGLTVTITTSAATAATQTFNTTNSGYWTDPHTPTATIAGVPSIQLTIPTTGSTVTITFSKPVDNPVMHIDRLGGSAAGTANSSSWTLTGSSASSAVTMSRLSGNAQFTLSGTNFVRTTGGTGSGTECDGTATGTACGTVQFAGTNITQLVFSTVMAGGAGSGDALELAFTVPQTLVVVRKQTVNAATGSFSFTGTNGVTAHTLNTTTSNPATSSSFSVTNHANPITISETVTAGYRIDSTSCTNEGGGTVTSTFTGTTTGTGTINIAAAAYDGGGQTITCTVVNTSRSDMSVNLSGLGPATLNTPYTGTYTCSNAASPYLQADAATCAISGLPAGLTSSCSPTPPTNVATAGVITCTVSGTPTAAGTVTLTGTTSATNDLNTTNNTATASFTVQSSDMTISLAGLPTTASIGVPYSGSFTCTNGAAPSVTATNASCAVTGLPAGLTTSCTPTPPASVAPSGTISCTVSGTPTATGTASISGTTGATNDSNTSNNTASTSITVTGSDMSVDLSGLPTSASIGVAYTGTIRCTNNSGASASATSATCSTTGLPAGVTIGTCTPTPPATVAAGASITCSVSGTPTATGTSTVTTTTGATNDTNGGTTTGGNNTSTASVTVTGSDMSPDLTGLPATATVGTPYSGTIRCTNSASATASATNATCSISGLPPGVTVGTCTPTPPATVAAGAFISCSVSGTPTASGTTTASVTTGATNDTNGGMTAGGNNTATKAVATVASDMSIDLSGLPTSGAVGQPYSGSFTCTNASGASASATAASCAVAGLPAGLSTSCTPTPPATIAAAASITCTVTGTPIAAGSSTVNGSTGATNDDNTSNNTATRTIAIGTPSLSVTKASTTTSFNAVGVSIPYTFVVQNNGTVSIVSPISVSDNKIASVSCPALPGGVLIAGASITCTGSYTTTQADLDAGGVTNTASATSGTTTSPTTNHTVPAVQSPAMTVLKTSTTANFSAVGVSIPYSYRVTNSGNVTLTSAISVSDNKIPSVSCPALPPGGLAPGAFITCTGSYTTTQADLDAGSVTNAASSTSGTTTSPTVNLTVPATQSRSLSITKTPATTTYSTVGAIVGYTYVVRNTGNVTIVSPATISVSDNKISSVSCPTLPPGGLAPNATLTCTGNYTITQADIDAGSVVNIASATDGTTTSLTVTATITAVQSPALTVAKSSTATTYSAAGASIPYSFRVTNSGNVTLTAAVTVSDNKIASVTCPALPPGGLAPGGFITCSGTYTTTQADVDAGSVTNVASAQSGTTTSPTTNLTINATQSPALTIAKSTTTASFNAVGTSIPYSYRVTNTGNVTLTAAVSVSDNKIPSVTCPALPPGGLAPGAFITCTGSYTTTQADLDAGAVTNTASAASGTTTSPSVNVTVPAVQTRALTTVKSSTTTVFSTVGQVIPYSYRVTNAGNVTLTSAVTVADNKIPSVSCPALPPGGLAPGAFITCTGNYTVTQADLDAGSVANTASSTSGTTTSPTVTLSIPASQSPALTVVKSSTTTSYGTVGASIPYSYRVTNSGNVTLTSAITVADDKIPSVSCPALPPGGLAPNAFITCTGTHTVTQADIDAGSLTNTASATSGTTTSPTVSITIPAATAPALTVVKSTTATSYTTVGTTIPYTFVVTNSGNTTLTSAVTVTDSKIASVTCPSIGAGLAPAASITCTGTYTVTQADIDGGNIVNLASATSGTVTSPTVTHTLNGTQTRGLTIAKASTTTSITTAGQVVPYTYTLTNSGNVTLTTAAAVTDNKIPSVSCPALPPGGLVPGASITCTASYTVTQADVDSGNVANTASATSGTSSGTVTSNTAALTIPVAQSPRLAVVKNSTSPPFTAVGQSIPYTYVATNTGNVTLTSAITVSDNKIASVSCPALPPGGLAPGASITCSGTYTTTQADLDAGSVTNIATAQSGTTVSTPVSFTVNATQTRSLSMTKSGSPTTYAAVGTTINYTYVVRNTGNITITSPAVISVSDNKIASVTCPALPPGGLAPNATLTCTAPYTITQADIDAGSVTNIATATDGTVTSPNATATVTATQTSALTIAKSTTTASFSAVGTVVPYSFRVTNTGNVTLTSAITVTDNKIASVACPALPPGGLAPAAFITCTGSYTTTQADLDAGSVINTATAHSGTTNSAGVSHTLPAAQTRSLALTKTASPTSYNAPGVAITYTYVVRNTGNVTVPASATISVTDDKIASVLCPAIPVGGLAPNATLTCTATHTTTQANVDAGSITNVASATDGTATSPTATATVTAVQTPALTIAKSTTATTFSSVGQVIPYSFRVTNTGNTTVTAPITVSDNKVASVSCPALPPGGLAPAAFVTCTGSYTITQADIDAGNVVNVASATSGTTTSPTTTHTLNATQSPALTIAKSSTATTFSAAGATIPYSYRVTNSGNTTLTASIAVSDNKIPSVSCPALPPGGLAPGAFITCTATYTVAQADVDAGLVTNVASATSGTVTSPTATLTINATQSPALTVLKTSTTSTFTTAGTIIPYSFRVTNTGNTTLTAAITVSDNKIASVSCPALPPGGLAPAAFITCTGSYTTTQADVDAGGITNTATARSGTTTSPVVNLTITAPASPALSIAKNSTTTTFGAAGVAIPYTYVVTNTGNVTLTSAITVTDNKIPSVTCPALPPAGLAPGASITCAATYTTVQADVDAGSVANTATAHSGTTNSPSVSLSIPASQSPGLSMVKASTTTTFAAPGVSIPYTYRVTNTGNTTLTSAITVSDDKIASVSCPALPPAGLAPGAFITCTGTYPTTQADVDAGAVTNNATARSGTVTSPVATLTITSTRTPALTVLKSTTATTFSAPGTVIPYSFRVTNSGNTTLTAAVSITDDKVAAVSCPALPPGGLAPGAFITCTGSYTTTQADVDTGSVTNNASATSGTTTSPTVTHTLTGSQTPALAIVKSSTATGYNAVGQSIPYSYRVTNAGNVTLTAAITVSDNKIASVSCPALPVGGLAPGSFITCTATYTVTQADIDAGTLTNIASARSGTTNSPNATVTLNATQSPALTVLKTSTTSNFNAVGVAIPYSYRVTNTGNVTLTQPVTVSDNRIASVSCPALPPAGLAPGAFITCTATYTTTQADVDAGQVANTASATSGTTTSPTVTLTITATQTPALTIAKTSSTTNFNAVGTVIPYSYRVTNSGNVTLTQPITVADNKIPSVTCPALPPAGLAPGAFVTCTGSYTVTQADLNAGSITNTASASSGTTTSPIVLLTISATQSPSLTTVKSSTTTTFSAVGVVIPYTYRVTNTGNITLTQPVTVTDNKIPAVNCPALPPGGLAPGAFITCTGNYTTTQADLDAGSLTNAAAAQSGTTTSPTVTYTITATQTPALQVEKTSTTTSFNAVGAVIPYSYRVTNTGNVTVTAAITVADDKIPTVTCPALPPAGLAPGAFITCTGNYTTTQADIDAGRVTNRATATSGTTTSPPVTLTINAVQQPALTVAKTSTVTSFNAVGVVIPYSYRVTNSGNVTLTAAISVTDDKIPTVTCPALPPAGLAPGAAITCTGNYTTTQADLDASRVTNVASARSGTTTSPNVTLTINATQTPALTIAKTSTATTYAAAGDVIPYSYRVTNTGNVTLTTAITVTDDKIPTVNCPALPPGGMAPGASITCTASYTVTQADLNAGTLTNIASARSGTVISPNVSLTLTGTIRPDFSIVKTTPSSLATNNGDGTFTTTFRVVATNTGNIDLTQIRLTDDYAATLPPTASVIGANFIALASSTRGPLSTGNTSYDARAMSPELIRLPGESLAVGESITADFTITFDPGSNPSGTSFNNTAVGTAYLTAGNTTIYSASKNSIAAVAFQPNAPLVVTKTSQRPEISVGGLVPYTITVRNEDNVARSGLSLIDFIPAGFKYREGTGTVNGIAREPTIAGRQLTWTNISVPARGTVTVRLMLTAGAGLTAGEYTNEAWLIDASTGLAASNVASAKVRIVPDATFDCTDIIGKVFDDANRNGYLDDGERGIANVRLVTVNGQIITTDSEGRYHITCADIPNAFRGSNFVLKLDVRSLPTGYRVTTENPMSMRITAGKMAKMNFGASIQRVVRIDVMEAAFEPGSTALRPAWVQSASALVPSLLEQHAVLRIAYRRGAAEDKSLATERLRALEAVVREAWRRQGGKGELPIESEVYLGPSQSELKSSAPPATPKPSGPKPARQSALRPPG